MRVARLLLAAPLLACSSSPSSDPAPQPSAKTPAPDATMPAPATTDAAVAVTRAVTWHADVRPIVERSCRACHEPGGIASFSLASYADAREHHQEMSAVVAIGEMPPWKPAASCQSFKDARLLPAADAAILRAWSAAGAPEGTPPPGGDPPAAAPPALPSVDMMLEPAEAYTPRPRPDRPDDYHCFTVDPQLGDDRFLIGYDIRPGARSEVHHVALFDAMPAAATAADAREAGPGWTCYGGPGTGTSTLLGSWVPGSPPTVHPATTGIKIARGHVIVMQIHYNNSFAAPTPDRTRIALQLSREPVARPAVLAPIVETTFRLAPGAMNQVTSASLRVPQAQVLWGVQPHMHTLGKRITVELTSGGASTCLLDIPGWDFNWQQLYFYQRPTGIALPAGSTVKVTCTWDNTTDRAVTFGEGTGDEMCAAVLYLTPP
jgi:hypothetical protein